MTGAYSSESPDDSVLISWYILSMATFVFGIYLSNILCANKETCLVLSVDSSNIVVRYLIESTSVKCSLPGIIIELGPPLYSSFNKDFIFPELIIDSLWPILLATSPYESIEKFSNFISFSLSSKSCNTLMGDKKNGS